MLNRCAQLVLVLALLVGSSWSAQARGIGLVRDAEIEGFLSEWSRQVLTVAGLSPSSVEINLVSQDELNAFVTGGQNIFIDVALLLQTTRPEQVIAVLAHEAGHIAGGHLTRSVDQQRQSQLQALAVTLLSVGAAAATGRSEIGVAGAAGASQIAREGFFSFSRAQEQVADNASVNYLAAIGLPPEGSVGVLKILQRQERLYRSSAGYTTTHPLTDARIANMQNAAARSRFRGRQVSQKWVEQHAIMRAKLVGFLKDRTEILRRYPRNDNSAPARYARAISAYRHLPITQSVKELDALILSDRGNPYYHELKGQALLENGYLNESVYAYEQAIALSPSEPLILGAAAHALIEQPNAGSIQKGLNYVQQALSHDRDNVRYWRLAATAQGRLGQAAQSALSLAEAFLASGDFGNAKQHATRARQGLQPSDTAYLRASDILRSATIGQQRKKRR